METGKAEKLFTEKEANKYFAAKLFNFTWDLMEKPHRSTGEDILMVHAAHASAFHWLQVGVPVNFQRSAWQLARVYTLLGDKDKSLYYANKCLEMTRENGLKDFDIAYAYEGMARASALNGNRNEYDQYKTLAFSSGKEIGEQEDKELFFKDISSGPWFGMQ